MRYVIAGFGKFGRLALDRLSRAFPPAEILVVEKRLDGDRTDRASRTTFINADAVSFLAESGTPFDDDVVVPMVPFHLAAGYILALRTDFRQAILPANLHQKVPNPFRLNASNLLCSKADFLCPDDCPEGELCTVTGEPRDIPLYEFLATMEIPGFTITVQRSFQILPGIGGYTLGELRRLAARLGAGPVIVATSCKCHGILTSIEV